MSKMEKTSMVAGLLFGATGDKMGAVGSHALAAHPAETLKFFQNRKQIPNLPCSVSTDIRVTTPQV